MKCNQVVQLVNRFMDNRICTEEKYEFMTHIGNCENCREGLWHLQSVYDDLSGTTKAKAPEFFTEQVMSKILNMKISSQERRFCENRTNYSLVYKRLGFSMILTAAIMLFSIYVPFSRINLERSIGYKTNEVLSNRSVNVTGALGNINEVIKSVFKNINYSIEKFKEV